MSEPIHDLTIRSTANSEFEGRLNPSFLSRKKKNSLARKIIKEKKYGDKH